MQPARGIRGHGRAIPFFHRVHGHAKALGQKVRKVHFSHQGKARAFHRVDSQKFDIQQSIFRRIGFSGASFCFRRLQPLYPG